MMDLQELLPLYALGILAPEEQSFVEQAIAEQPALAAELAQYQDTAAELFVLTPPVAPSAHVKHRLMSSIGAGRFERFTAAFARIFDVTAEKGRELLGWVEDPSRWEVMDAVAKVIHFPAGPACAGADTGFVRVAPGGTFPYHGHGGHEISIILAGSAITSDGKVLRAGDEVSEEPGTAHDLSNTGEEDFIYASRVYGVDYSVPKPQK
jgi:mannose-6-phosphate isomerase-like protein (cupin superfamily)